MRLLEPLRLFDHLAQTRHFGRTSAACHVSQPTLSRTIARLEAELGVRLLDRDRRGVALTPDGARFLGFARSIIHSWDQYAEDPAPSETLKGRVAVFSTVTAAQSILPDLLRRFRLAHPAVQLDLQTGYAAEALQRLDDRTVDVTVAALPPRVPRHLVTRVLATTSLALVAPLEDHRELPRLLGPGWSGVPFVLPSTGVVRALADRWFRRLKLRPHTITEATGHEAVLSLVTLGCGVGVVPLLVAESNPLTARLRIIAASDDPPSFDIAACTTVEQLSAPPVQALWSSLAIAASRGTTG